MRHGCGLPQTSLKCVPLEKVAILPNLAHFDLTAGDGGPDFNLAVHMPCPSARYTSPHYKKHGLTTIPKENFPNLVSGNAIIPQCTRSQVEEVTLVIKTIPVALCSLTFRSLDGTILKLRFSANLVDERKFVIDLFERKHCEVFTQATRVVRVRPQAKNVKRIRICDDSIDCDPGSTATTAGQLFESLGPLDEPTIHRCDPQPYFCPLAGLHPRTRFIPVSQGAHHLAPAMPVR